MSGDAAIGVGFDVDHTIVIDNKLERVAFLRLLEQVVDAGGRVLGTLDAEIERIDDLLVRQRGGAFSIDEAVRHFVRERGIARDEECYAERFKRMALDMVDEFVIPLPGAKHMFAALRERGVRVAVLSNGWNPLQERKARRAGFKGSVLASAQLGVQKPDRRAFAALLAELKTPADRSWYVGDDPRCDVEGARAAGLRAVWLDAQGAFPSDLPPPTYAIETLERVVEVVLAPERAVGEPVGS